MNNRNIKDNKNKIAVLAENFSSAVTVKLYEISGHEYVVAITPHGGASVVHAASCWCQEGRRGDVG